MKKIGLLVGGVFLCMVTVYAQSQEGDIPSQKRTLPKSDVHSWNIDERFGFKDSVAVDTLITSYQDNNPVNNYSIANSWNGNLGSPLQSKIYFDRTNKTDYLFSLPYDAYMITPENVSFFSTKTPYSQLVYRSALPKYSEEDYFKALLTMNANKRLNIGGLFNYIYARGQYANQGAELINGGFWMSYENKHYSGNAVIMFNRFKNHENGGISDPAFILNPSSIVGSSSYSSKDIPTNLTGVVSGYNNDIYFYNQRYRFGKDMERKVGEDSVATEFVPISSIIHTIKFENARRRYYETTVPAAFYDSTFLNNSYTNDSSRYWSLKNTVSFTLEEDFNRILHFGLAAFVEYDLRYHALVFDSVTDGYYENHLKVGALISKQKGKILTYDAQGDVYVLGPKAGEFEIFGNIHTVFNVKKDVLRLDAGVGFYNETVNNFVEHFSSNHFRWDNDFKNNLRFNAKVRFSVPTRDVSIGAQMENVTNLVYFNTKGLPEQYDGNVQVVALDAVANVRVWRFHLDNQFVYQYTSNRDILPLPDFSLYSTLYYKDKFFKVLTFQAGVSVRYHTAYYGPVYVPATGQFRVQNEQLIGNYPVLNAYLNFHLKRMRFYVQYAHWNKGLFDLTNYFSMPNYPINPGTFQFGLSWTFYN
ncbi:MAG: putative porin [Paludibacteraceae bacterium]|nr:putative porin [Paludibacteraceae bacterium]